jgi:DNA-binding NtrC family response regulator
MVSGSAQTTMPSNETLGASSGGGVLSIRWMFPQRDGRLTRLEKDRVLLGRDKNCDVHLEGTETSRQHAEIRREGSLYVLRDLGSRNGVYVNGKAISDAPLAPGLVLRLGEWIGTVVLTLPQAIDASKDTSKSIYSLLAPGLAGGPVLRQVLGQLERAASSKLPIVLLGETGTGKEGCSRAVHEWSHRRGAFVAVNCAALPNTLAEAELFGYRKGAFTGADRAHAGYFRAAHGGTLLLDEVTDLPLELQGKLLRVIEQNEVHPLGESAPVAIDVRIIAATQIPLSQVVEQRRFRPDLCARLEGLTVSLPPLRARKEEIPYLFLHLLAEHSGGHPPSVEPRLIEQLCLYDWPYNVRELDLLVRRLLVLHAHEGLLRRSQLPEHVLRISDDELPAQVRQGQKLHAQQAAVPSQHAEPPVPNTPQAHRARRERELKALRIALRQSQGNVARAASSVGISRQRAYRLMEQADAQGDSDGSPDANSNLPDTGNS